MSDENNTLTIISTATSSLLKKCIAYPPPPFFLGGITGVKTTRKGPFYCSWTLNLEPWSLSMRLFYLRQGRVGYWPMGSGASVIITSNSPLCSFMYLIPSPTKTVTFGSLRQEAMLGRCSLHTSITRCKMTNTSNKMSE